MTKSELTRQLNISNKALRALWLVLHLDHHRPGRYGKDSTVWTDLGVATGIVSLALQQIEDTGLTPAEPSQDERRAKEAQIDAPFQTDRSQQLAERNAELYESWHDIEASQ